MYLAKTEFDKAVPIIKIKNIYVQVMKNKQFNYILDCD